MRLFGSSKKPDINAGVERFTRTPGALLVDVRTEEEYRGAHIVGSVNIPISRLDEIGTMIPNKDKPLYVYCHSGGRSGRAAELLSAAGYTRVSDIGGIMNYRGKLITKGRF